MTEAFWRSRYLTSLAIGAERATSGPNGPWPLAFGFANSIDRINLLDAPLLERLAGEHDVSRGALTDWAYTPRDFVSSVVAHMAAGRGGEIWLGDPALGAWLASEFTGRPQVGGTGIRGANTIAGLGFGSLLHVTSFPPAQASLIDPTGIIRVPTPAGLLPPLAAARPDDPALIHYILEYPADLEITLGDQSMVTPQANRLIISLEPANFRHPITPSWIDAIAAPPDPIRWVLISGYSQVTSTEMGAARIAESIAAIARWRQLPRPPRIHLELGAMPNPAIMDLVLTTLAPVVDSIGLNADEVRTILASRDLAGPGSDTPVALVPAVLRLRELLGVPRLGVHTQDFCLTVTNRNQDPKVEQAAQMYGSLVAGAFARTAEFPTQPDLAATMARARIAPAGLAAVDDLTTAFGLSDGISQRGDAWIVVAPTLAIPHPRTTIGLGDSFSAGLIALL